jgi:hypothetical protein
MEIECRTAPEHRAQIVKDYGDWMARNDIPKLFISGDPGAVIIDNLELRRT